MADPADDQAPEGAQAGRLTVEQVQTLMDGQPAGYEDQAPAVARDYGDLFAAAPRLAQTVLEQEENSYQTGYYVVAFDAILSTGIVRSSISELVTRAQGENWTDERLTEEVKGMI